MLPSRRNYSYNQLQMTHELNDAQHGVVWNYWKKLDKSLLFSVIACSVISVLLLISIWQNDLLSSVDDSQFTTQIFASLIGIVCVIILLVVDYHKIVKLWYIYAPIALLFTLLCFTSLGVQRDGADDQAWLDLGFITFQPSELLKLAFILTFSLHLEKDEENMNKPLHMLLLCIHGAIPVLLIALQGDYGTAIIFACIFLGMLLSSKISWKYVLALAIAIPVILVLAWNFVLSDSHKERILVLFNPGSDPEGVEYQQNLGLSALANGEMFGQGLFAGEDAYVSVPEMHNDFIFAHVGQCFGFVGAMIVVLLLAFICLKCLYNGLRSTDRLGMFICIGVFSMFLSHCILNIGMVLKVAPVIGVPLPFLSAGGTATVCMYIAIGFVISIYSHNQKPYSAFDT